MALQALHVAQPLDGGVARCVLSLATGQSAAGIAVAVACPPRGELASDLRSAGVPTVPWEAGRSPGPGTLDEIRRLAAVLADHDPALVHLHSAKAGLAGRLAVRGSRPTVFQPHAWSYEAVRGPVRAATLRWERAAVRWTDLLVCVSGAELAQGRSLRTVPTRATVIPNGVDLVRFPAQDGASRAAARRRLGLDDAPLAVCVGRLARQKGQDVAIQAWPGVREDVAGATLVLVGGGPAERDLRAAAGAGVRLAGPTTQVVDYYAAADVVLVPSRWEGMALTVLEAMSSGRSVVASDVTGMRDAISADAGALVPPEQPAALRQAVSLRLSGRVDGDAEGRRGRAHVEAAHDLEKTVATTTAAYAPWLAP